MQFQMNPTFSFNRRHLASLLAAALLSSSLANANAPGPDPRKIQRYDVPTTVAKVPGGGARASVIAPAGVVKSVVTDFKNYANIITRFEKARIVGRSGDKTDVYLQVPIMKGAAKIWAVVRFEPPVS